MAAPARITRPTPRNLARLAGVLQRGGLVALPTETVYGLAADALDADACAKIFRAKGRPATDPLIVHVLTLAQADEVAALNPAARKLAAAFWPGPLTLVLPKREIVPAMVTAGLPSVAVRMPKHPLFRKMLRLAGRPLAAPSANPFGYVSPTTAAHVRAGLGRRIAHILDGGPSQIGVESTVLDLRDPDHPVLLRPGAVARAAIAAVLRRRVRLAGPAAKSGASALIGLPGPGMLDRHYSPRTPLTLTRKIAPGRAAAAPEEAFLFFRRPEKRAEAAAKNVFWLTSTGSLEEAAHNLFDRLRHLDGGGWRAIHAERIPARGALGPALNDRLARAAAQGGKS
jgi:L-threonylcarbamoyladenylate synthase